MAGGRKPERPPKSGKNPRAAVPQGYGDGQHRDRWHKGRPVVGRGRPIAKSGNDRGGPPPRSDSPSPAPATPRREERPRPVSTRGDDGTPGSRPEYKPRGTFRRDDRGGSRPDSRGPRPDSRGPRPDSRGPRPDSRGPRPDSRGPRPDSRGPRPDSRGPRPDSRGPRPDSRGPRPDSRGPRPDSRGPRPDSRGPRPDSRGPRPDSGGGERPPFRRDDRGGRPRPDSGGPRPDSRGPRPDSGGPRPDSRGPRPDSRGPRPDSRGGDRPQSGRPPFRGRDDRGGGARPDSRVGKPAGGPRGSEGRGKNADPDAPVLFMRTRKPWTDPDAIPLRLNVVYEDADVLAVAKPAGINVAQENEGEGQTSVQTQASEYLEKRGEATALIGPRARLVHRIDKDTSGIVLFAKSPRAQSSLGGDWEAGKVEKVYDVLVHGVPEASAAVIDKPIGRDPDKKARRAVGGLDSQEARTRYRVVETFGRFSLLEVRPLTGRTHQIRVHMKSIGCPLAIDELYGEGGPTPPAMKRLTLHARAITFTSPSKGKRITIEAPLAVDFAACLDALRGRAASDADDSSEE